jgi:hypothetical protein
MTLNSPFVRRIEGGSRLESGKQQPIANDKFYDAVDRRNVTNASRISGGEENVGLALRKEFTRNIRPAERIVSIA